MEPAIDKLKIVRGANFQKTYYWKDSAGASINLTGYTAKMQIRKDLQADDSLIDLTTANSRIVLTAVTGKIDLIILGADTATLPAGAAVGDLFLYSGSNVYSLVSARIEISPASTK